MVPLNSYDGGGSDDHRYGCLYLWPVCLTPVGWLCDGGTIFARENVDAPDSTKTSQRSPRSSAQISAKSLQFVLRYNFSCAHCTPPAVCPETFHRIHCPDLHAQKGYVCQANWQIWLKECGSFAKIHRSNETRTWLVGRWSFFCRVSCFPFEWRRHRAAFGVKNEKFAARCTDIMIIIIMYICPQFLFPNTRIRNSSFSALVTKNMDFGQSNDCQWVF